MRQGAVLVTGCSSGIGRAVAREFARRGRRCFATARRAESVSQLEDEGLEGLRLDVTDPDSIGAAVDTVIERAGSIEILVNNAGTSLFGPLMEVPLAEVRELYETNTLGCVAVLQAVFPHMAQRESGRIVNVGSLVGVVPTPWAAAYCGTKAALHAMSDALRVELAPFGIDVVVVQPGRVQSSVADNSACHADTPHYAPVASAIRARSRGSQTNAMPAEFFARRVVDAALSTRAPRTLRAGNRVGAIRALGWLPGRLRDAVFRRAFGISKLAAARRNEMP